MKLRNNFYNKFHSELKIQKKVINDNNFTYQPLLKIFNKYIKKGMSILDIGCGVGTLGFYYAKKGNNVTAVDISENAVRFANENAKFLDLSNKIKFHTLNFPVAWLKRIYDIIIITEVLEHIEDDNASINKIEKMLKRDGSLLLTVPSENSFLYRIGLLNNFDKKVGHLRRYNVQKLESLLKKNGLYIEKYFLSEGIIRNMLFSFPTLGKTIRFIKGVLASFINLLDRMSILIFGESEIIIIAKKLKS